MYKKILLIIFLSFIIIALSLFMVNSIIEEKIQKEDIINHFLVQKIIHNITINKQKLDFQYSFSYFHLLQGLRINNIKIINPKGEQICKIEQIILQFNLTKLILDLKPKKILIYNLECNYNDNLNLYSFFQQIFNLILKNTLELELYSIKFPLLEYNFSNLNLLFIPHEQNKIKIKGKLIKEDQNSLEVYGLWDVDKPQNRIYLNISNFHWKNKKSLFLFFPLEEISIYQNFPKVFNNIFNINFLFKGKGSIDLTKEGYAINLGGNILSFSANSDLMNAKNLSGKFHFSQIKAFDKNFLQESSLIEFDNFKFELNKKIENYQSQIFLKGNLDINNSNISTSFNSKGDANFELKIFEAKNKYDILANVHFNKFIFIQIPNFPIIFFKNLSISTNGVNNFNINIDGTINSLDFNYKGNIIFNPFINPSWQLKGNFTLMETNYQNLLELFINLYKYYIKEVTKDNVKKIEDLGPAWENKFIQSDIYKIYIKNIKMENSLSLINSIPNNLPEIYGNITNNESQFSLNLNSINNQSTIKIQYNINYLSTIPSHNLVLLFDLIHPNIEIPIFCNNCKDSINKLYFSYNSNSNGIYIADFYLNNSSNLILEIDSIKIQNDYRRDLIENLLDIQLKEKLLRLKIKFSSFGASYNPIEIELDNDIHNIKGFGNYNIFNVGELKFYYYNKNNGLNRNFLIKIRKDGVWIPSYLY